MEFPKTILNEIFIRYRFGNYIYLNQPSNNLFFNYLWCFYSLYLKPFWKIPNSFRDIAIFLNYFSWKCTRFGSKTLKKSQIWCIFRKTILQKLLFLINYLEFSETVWDTKSKNIKDNFNFFSLSKILIYIYITSVWRSLSF